ncbi:MAG: hypothetical protein WBN40_04100, partial [Pseudomonadales bacterium]
LYGCGSGGGSNDSTESNDPGSDAFDVSAVVDLLVGPNGNIVAQSAPIGTAVGIKAFASDEDATNNAVTYSIVGGTGLFAIDSMSGDVTVDSVLPPGPPLPYTVVLTIQAASADGSSSSADFVIDVIESLFSVSALTDANSLPNEVFDNAIVGDRVGVTLFAEDLDTQNNRVSYSLSDDAGGLFTVDSLTGIVTVAVGAPTASASPYTITGVALSEDGTSSSANIAIEIIADTGPALTLQFPAQHAVTDTATINLRGLAQPNVASLSAVTSVVVDNAGVLTPGVLGTGESWRATGVDLNNGHNVLIITATDAAGAQTIQRLEVGRVDFSGAVSLGVGPVFPNPLWLDFDPLKQFIYLAEESSKSVVLVDQQTGNRVFLADVSIGGTGTSTPAGISLDLANNRLLIADSGLDRVVAYDLDSASLNVISSNDIDPGVRTFRTPQGNLELVDDELLVIDQASRRRFYSVDVFTGSRSTIIDFDDDLSYFSTSDLPNTFALDATGSALVAVGSAGATLDAVLAVEITTGATTPIATLSTNSIAGLGPIGSGVDMTFPSSIEYDTVLDRALVSDADLDAIIAIDLATLARTEVSGPGRGSGNHLQDGAATGGNAMRYDEANNVAYAINFGLGEIVMIDIESGDQVIISK